jgi:hypothetical protein
MLRRLWWEVRLAMSPGFWLLPLAWLVLAAMRSPLGGGAAVWARHFPENCEAFLPVAVGIASTPALLAEEEQGLWELNGALPVGRVAAVRMGAFVGGMWLATIAWLVVLRFTFGPVPFGSGLLAASGPGLLLGGLGTWAATATGRVTMGYLMVVGLPVADLILKILGAFSAVPVLNWLNVFAYRWAVPAPPWPVVKAVMAVLGILLYAVTVVRWRHYGLRQV